MIVKRCLCTVVAAISFVTLADRVELKSGSFLTGSVKSATKDSVVFASEDLGDVSIQRANIVKLDVGMHTVRYLDNREEQIPLQIANGAYVSGAKPLDVAEVKAIDPVAEKWHGSVSAGYTGKRGNTYEDSAAVRADVTRKWERDRVLGRLSYDYGKNGTAETDNKKTTDKWEAELKHDHFWLSKVYTYEDLLWERDMIKNLQARYNLGLGLGYQWLEDRSFDSTGKWNFNQELGANWVKEEWDGVNDDAKKNGFGALRYAHHLGFVPKWTANLEFFHNLRILPQVDEWSKFIAKADVGFQAKLVYDFTLDARIEWDYDSKPADDMKKDDFRYIVGLGYKW